MQWSGHAQGNLYSNTTHLQLGANGTYSSNCSSDVTPLNGDVDRTTVLYYVLRYSNSFLIPVIIVVGLVGNALSFCVFRCTSLRSYPSNVYLSALALADSGFLLMLSMTWLNVLHVPLFHTQGLCQLFVYLTYVFGFLSVWYVVTFTVERFVVVCYPLYRYTWCTSGRARLVVASFAGVAAVAYSFTLWTSKVVVLANGSRVCTHLSEYDTLLSVAGHIDSFVTLLVPFVIIFVMNSKIVYVMFYSPEHRQLSDMNVSRQTAVAAAAMAAAAAATANVGTSVGDAHAQQVLTRNASQNRITKTLVVVSMTFLVLNLPSHVVRVYILLMTSSGRTEHVTWQLRQWQQMAQLVYYVNFAVNFFLYSLCGRNFRSYLRKVVRPPCTDKEGRSTRLQRTYSFRVHRGHSSMSSRTLTLRLSTSPTGLGAGRYLRA